MEMAMMMATPNDDAMYGYGYRKLHPPALIIGGCFALVAVSLSFFLMFQHLRSYTNPAEQKWIVAVIFMVPVYATESFISLWNPRLSFVCDILRSCYEAFALYSFGRYLVACLGGERRVLEILENESREELSTQLLEETNQNRGTPRRSFVSFFFRPLALGSDLFIIERFSLVQYMILKTFCAFLAFILELFGIYGDGEFKWYYGYPYIAVVLNFSQMWALYCLIQFYNVMYEKLKPIRPLAKFVSFKAIVFATWWQGVGIALLCAFGVLPKEGKFQTGLQNFLICIEMAIAAVAHVSVFSAEPYHFIPSSVYGKVTTETTKGELKLELEEGGKEKPAMLEKKETHVEAPGTSVTESVQDIVLRGGQSVSLPKRRYVFFICYDHRLWIIYYHKNFWQVVKDVVLTINQAIGPVEKGVTKIQETLHHRSVGSADAEEVEVKVEEHVEENITGS